MVLSIGTKEVRGEASPGSHSRSPLQVFAPRLHGDLRPRRLGRGQTNQREDEAIHSAGQKFNIHTVTAQSL